jgi:uncharacterized protein YjbI with pentapeptide repeats
MRGVSAFVVMALLVAPVCVRGEDVARPVPADGQCSIPADEHWTPQEQFVWSRVCVGEKADFNKEPGYGGDLDPKSPDGLPESRILSSGFLETILLRDKYRDALTRRGVRIGGARFTEVIDLENAELGHDLWLDKSLLEKGANLMALRTRHRITIDDSKVGGSLYMAEIHVDRDLTMHSELGEVDLENAQIGGGLDFSGSKVAKGLDLSYAQIGGKLDFTSAVVSGKLNMEAVQISGHLAMKEKAEFSEVDISSAHIQGVLSLYDAKITGPMKLTGLQVDGMVYAEGAQFSEVNLWLARIGGIFDLAGSKATGNLDMQGIQIARPLLISNAEFAGVDLTVARVQGLLSIYDSKFTGPFTMFGAQIDGMLEAGGSELSEADLSFAHIGGELKLDNVKAARRLNMQGIRVDGDLIMNNNAKFAEVDLTAGHVHGLLSLWGAKLTGPLDIFGIQLDGAFEANGSEFAMINLMSANLQQRVNLSDSKVSGGVDLAGARVGGDLLLNHSKIDGPFDCSSSEIGGTAFLSTGAEFGGGVTCHFAKLGELELADAAAFHNGANFTGAQITGELRVGSATGPPPKWLDGSPLVLRNARADSIHDSESAWPARIELNGFTYRSFGGAEAAERDRKARPVKWFKSWLGKQDPYAPAPYEQLASVLRSQGQPEAADDMLYASKERERTQAPFLRRAWLTATKWVIGYGYHIERTLMWIAGFLIAGIAVLRISGEGPSNGMPFGIAYSFDMLLPIIRLREKHYTEIDLQGWPRYYFYVHKIMGYVLASFLIVGLAGLTK